MTSVEICVNIYEPSLSLKIRRIHLRFVFADNEQKSKFPLPLVGHFFNDRTIND